MNEDFDEDPSTTAPPVAQRTRDPEYYKPLKRPHGGTLMGWGLALALLGIAAFVIGMVVPTISSPGSPGIGDYIAATPPMYNEWKWPLIWLGAASANLGLILWAFGLIIRAIFFLPGRDPIVGETWPKD